MHLQHLRHIGLISATTHWVDFCNKNNFKDCIVVSPDAGGAQRATEFMNRIQKKNVNVDFGIIQKQRGGANVVKSMIFTGMKKGKVAVLIDDMGDTCGTLIKAVEQLKSPHTSDGAASYVYAYLNYGIFSKDALDKIAKCDALDKLFVTNTCIDQEFKQHPKIEVIDVSSVFYNAMINHKTGESVSELFN